MNLDDIEGGSLCVIDTNVLLYAERGVSDQAQRLIRRCATGELDDLTKTAFRLQEKYGLLTNDAMMLGIVIRLKADALVSHDKAFRFVTELPVHFPTDLRL